MDRPGLLELMVAPLTWVERTKGWRRVGLVLLYLLIATAGGLLGWRELSLRKIPGLAEPFDEAKLGTVNVRDADNAMIGYAEAARRIKPLANQALQDAGKTWSFNDWSSADASVRRWTEENRPALELYLRAADRPDALLYQPKAYTIETPFDQVHGLREFARLAILEGSRREQAGDLEGAWRCYRAILRSSRHVGRHGAALQRLIGHSLLTQGRSPSMAWANHPGVTSAMLRRAIDDVGECAALTSPASEMIRAEYFATRSALDHPDRWQKLGLEENPENASDWYRQYPIYHQARRFLRHEPERSRRLLRLIVAGQLAQCDRPRDLRPKVVSPNFLIYDLDDRTPAALRSIEPGELDFLARESVLGTFTSLQRVLARTDFEVATLNQLRLEMAERAYKLDHGKPPKTYGEFLGAYLKALPEGIEPGDSTTSGPGPVGP
jgi:hypothetical protein